MMKTGMQRFGLRELFLLALVSGVSVSASAMPNEKAKQDYQDGIALFEKGEYKQAAEKFRAAYAEKASWKMFFNIGQAEAAAHRYGLALEAFETYMVDGGDDVPLDKKELVLAEIKRLRVLVGVLELQAPKGAELVIDETSRGTMPFQGLVRVSAGKHLVTVKHQGEIIFQKEIRIAGGMTTTVEATTGESADAETAVHEGPDESGAETETDEEGAEASDDAAEATSQSVAPKGVTAKKLKIAGLIAGGVGVVGVGIGTAFLIKGMKDADDADGLARTDPARIDYNENTLPLNKAMTITGLALGGAGLTAGVILFVLGKKKEKQQKATVQPSYNGVSITF
ncbi:MAG: hypothetical protein JXX29_13485 [Deltaproteobacteria bacterium]|nr:hypothetical protein [Deltaproteobacteria bacterium]MBN2672691.1 hypothetical protein [Deltaproteobacteria bacterium]